MCPTRGPDDDLRALVDTVPGTMLYQVVVSPDGTSRFTYMSAGVEAVIGMSAAQVMADATSFYALTLADDLARLRAAGETARRTMSPFQIEVRQRTVAGDVRWIHIRSVPRQRLDDGSVVANGVAIDITDRKNAEENICGLLESAPDAMVIVDAAGRIVLVNAQTERMFGYPREALLGQSVEALIPERYLAQHVRHRGRYATDPQVRQMGSGLTLYGRRKDGGEFPIEISLSPLKTEDGTLVSAAIRDITQRQQADETLRARERQLRNLADNLPDGVVYQVVRRADGSNYFPYMSAGLERTFGLHPGEAMRDSAAVYRLILPEDAQRLRVAADESIRTGNPFDLECRLRAADGTVRWLNVRGRPIRLPDGATLWDAIALDITERKRTEEALREGEVQLRAVTDGLQRSEERFRRLFERSFVGIFRTRPDGIVVDCNDAFARILGYPNAAAMCGRDVIEHYVTPGTREAIVARLAAGEEVSDIELLGRRCDGSLVPVAVSARRVADAGGPVHEGIMVDLTDRKRAEEATALRAVAELANAAAHEINNPLAVIVGHLGLIKQGGDVAHGIGQAQDAASRIRDIVQHMVRITRLEASADWPASQPKMLDIRRSAPRGDT